MTKPGIQQTKPSENGVKTVYISYDLPAPVTQTKKVKKKPSKCLWMFCLLACLLCLAGGVYLIVSLVQWYNTPCYGDDGNGNATHIDTNGIETNPDIKIPFSFDDIWDYSLSPKYYMASWSSGEVYVKRDEVGNLIEIDAATGVETVIMSNDIFVQVGTVSYKLSDDRQYVLLPYERTKLWRYSYTARFKIYIRGAPPGSDVIDFPSGPLAGSVLQVATWGPNNALGFVYDYNLYYQASPTDTPIQVTTTGQEEVIFNGIPDWLYEEDVLYTTSTYYWSPDATYICYAEIDDTDVPRMTWPWYGDQTDMYGHMVDIAYAKPGDVVDGEAGNNPLVELYIFDSSDPGAPQQQVPPPTEFSTVDHYYKWVKWRDSTHVMVGWQNRIQNHHITMICDVTDMTCHKNYELQIPGGWIVNGGSEGMVIDGGANSLRILPRNEGILDGTWQHLALVSLPDSVAGTVTFLTSGLHTVTGIAGFDQTRQVVYYTTTNGDDRENHLFRVGTPSAALPDRPEVCISCAEGPGCLRSSGSFSDTGGYYFFYCNGPEIPTSRLRNADTGEETMLVNNSDVAFNLNTRDLPDKYFRDIDIGGNYVVRAQINLPPNHTPGKRYPLLVYVYAGPGSKMVSQGFLVGGTSNNWGLHMASAHGVAVASIDGRGSAHKGDNYMYEIYRRLGTVEIEDQIFGAEYMKSDVNIEETMPAAIWGWSYGGFATSHAIARPGSSTYECGISVAPVTHYGYYDTAYTEKYMSLATPADNFLGYNATDVTQLAANFQNKKFMVAHGSADDNVHFHNTMQLIDALEDEEIMFRQMMYKDQDHGISINYRHLYLSMTDFLMNECWPGYEKP